MDEVVDTAVCGERNQTKACEVRREGGWAERPPTKNLSLTPDDGSGAQYRHSGRSVGNVWRGRRRKSIISSLKTGVFEKTVLTQLFTFCGSLGTIS